MHWRHVALGLAAILAGLGSTSAASPGGDAASPPATLALSEAIDRALCQQPNLVIARAASRVGRASARIQRAALMPQLTLNGSYLRTTANFVARPGYVPGNVTSSLSGQKFSPTYDFWSFNLSLSQVVFDFGASFNAWRSSQALVSKLVQDEATALLAVYQQVSTAFLAVHTDQALCAVQLEVEANQARHLAYAEAKVAAGAAAQIDVAQARTGLANARLAVVEAGASLAQDRVALAQAMGVEALEDVVLTAVVVAALQDEDAPLAQAVSTALARRPDVRALDANVTSARLSQHAKRGGLAPTLGLTGSLSEQGAGIRELSSNWSVGAQVSWPLFDGLNAWETLVQAEARLQQMLAQRQALRLTVAAAVGAARASLVGAREGLVAAAAAEAAARQQLALAEGQYRAGTGSYLSLDDAQLSAAQATVTRLQKALALNQARLAWVACLGDPGLWPHAAL